MRVTIVCARIDAAAETYLEMVKREGGREINFPFLSLYRIEVLKMYTVISLVIA